MKNMVNSFKELTPDLGAGMLFSHLGNSESAFQIGIYSNSINEGGFSAYYRLLPSTRGHALDMNDANGIRLLGTKLKHTTMGYNTGEI